MSSSARSNAAARNRRAGGADASPQNGSGQQRPNSFPGQQQQRPNSMQGQQQQQRPNSMQGQQQRPNSFPGEQQPRGIVVGQQNIPAKMTIGDAIGLITIRLGRVENAVADIQADMPSVDEEGNYVEHNPNPNALIIDESVFNSIVSRIETIETAPKQTPIVQTTFTSSPVYDNKFTQLTTQIDILKTEIGQVKDLMLQLQSFTMETNKKLATIAFNEEVKLQSIQQNNNIDASNFTPTDQMSNEGEYNILIEVVGGQNVVDMKELIQQELATTLLCEKDTNVNANEIMMSAM
uniref:Uncharacterized protein n=1 Tax=viral metagenome TaxID=1070528 RepID=A0A6C0EVX5_9ZZZZ